MADIAWKLECNGFSSSLVIGNWLIVVLVVLLYFCAQLIDSGKY